MVTVEAGSKIVGFTFQFQRALYRLLVSEAQHPVIGIETEDDVVEVKLQPDGTVEVEFEQDKHTLQASGQPFQNSSKNLWHTLHIWLDAMPKMREKYDKITYCLVTNKNVSSHALVSKLSAAQTESEIKACIAEIRKRATNANEEDVSAIKAVAAFPDERLSYLIENLKLMESYGTASGEDPKQASINLLHLPPDLQEKDSEHIYQSLLGLVVDACQSAWKSKEQAWIDKSTISNRLHAHVQSLRMQKYIDRPLMSTRFKEYINEGGNSHLFLEQLRRIGVPVDYCDEALESYWGFYSERIRLKEEGNVLPEEWDARDQALNKRWKKISSNVKMIQSKEADEEATGRLILTQTIDGTYTASLGQYQTMNPYFTEGHYHDLANRADCKNFVHWHPAFCPKKDEGKEK